MGEKKDGLFGTIICTLLFNSITIFSVINMISDGEYKIGSIGVTLVAGSFGIGAICALIDSLLERKGIYRDPDEKSIKDLGYLIAGFGVIVGTILIFIGATK